MKTVLVICGTGVATSTMVVSSIRDHCQREGIAVDVRQGKVMDLMVGSPDADLIVATTAIPDDSVTVPVVAGMPFLTGVGTESALAEITRHLQSA